MSFISKSIISRQFLLNKSFNYFWLIYHIVKLQIYSFFHTTLTAGKLSKCLLLSPKIIKCILCVRVCGGVCISVSHRFLQNCYSYRFYVHPTGGGGHIIFAFSGVWMLGFRSFEGKVFILSLPNLVWVFIGLIACMGLLLVKIGL